MITKCTALGANDAKSTTLKIYRRDLQAFVSLESSPRLKRLDHGADTTYVFGPLTQDDDGKVLACFSNGEKSKPNIIVNL